MPFNRWFSKIIKRTQEQQPPVVSFEQPAISVPGQPLQPEQQPLPERVPEGVPERAPEREILPPTPPPRQVQVLPPPTTPEVQVAPLPPKSPTRQEVENILAEDLADIYQRLSPQDKARFRTLGEEIARRIEEMLLTLKASAQSVLDLIRRWLSVIPGVNRFFLEQESKLKTDKIMTLADKVRNEMRVKNIYHRRE